MKISSASPQPPQASTARAADGDYKTKGIGHEVKDSDGDYKPTKPTAANPPASSAAAASSPRVQVALSALQKGG